MFKANNPYLPQARLAVRMLRMVAEEPDFALKGGTAINLFFRDLLRLSVDLDLVYLPIADREASLVAIREGLERVAARAEKGLPGIKVVRTGNESEKLVVQDGAARVTVEVNTVLRGALHPPLRIRARPAVEEFFGDIEATVLSFEDCYAGKLVAALDRQHPRDLFDVHHLLAAEGLTKPLLDAFVVYLASHGRPISEVLQPRDKEIDMLFQEEFANMAEQPVGLDVLKEARARLVRDIQRSLLPRQVEFLRTVKAVTPDWDLIPHPAVRDMPGVLWKLHNLARLRDEQPKRYAEAQAKLNALLNELPRP